MTIFERDGRFHSIFCFLFICTFLRSFVHCFVLSLVYVFVNYIDCPAMSLVYLLYYLLQLCFILSSTVYIEASHIHRLSSHFLFFNIYVSLSTLLFLSVFLSLFPSVYLCRFLSLVLPHQWQILFTIKLEDDQIPDLVLGLIPDLTQDLECQGPRPVWIPKFKLFKEQSQI